jgi:hypothetical protein
MIEFSKFKRGPDFTGWLRAPQAEKFVQQLQVQEAAAMAQLIGACAMTTDPKVAGKLAAWQTITDLTRFLGNARKESSNEDE